MVGFILVLIARRRQMVVARVDSVTYHEIRRRDHVLHHEGSVDSWRWESGYRTLSVVLRKILGNEW
jgi:hypothetical protein